MFDIGFSELLLVAVIALVVLGPERLPSAARTVGTWVGRARRMMNQLNQEIDKQIKLEELREKLRQEGDTLGAEKIQETVDAALKEAKKFEHLVNQDIAAQPKAPSEASTQPASQQVPATTSNPDNAPETAVSENQTAANTTEPPRP